VTRDIIAGLAASKAAAVVPRRGHFGR
jgi:hypothetical protein